MKINEKEKTNQCKDNVFSYSCFLYIKKTGLEVLD